MNWMKRAIDLAEKGRSTCPPNPMVGCVIVKNNHIVGEGYHQITGGPHAEIVALQQAQSQAYDADVYVTLEPCCHAGRTGPCIEVLIQAGVRRVHIAIQDPNPLVAGRGIEKLRQAGIEVLVGDCQDEAYYQNQTFFHYITKKSPYVIAKWAMTLDGKIATSRGQSKWITSETAREHAHGLRSQVCGIMVGGNTVRLDNSQLTVRVDVTQDHRQPRPIIVTASGNILLDSPLFESRRNPIIITSNQVPSSFLRDLENRRIDHHKFPLVEETLPMKDVLLLLAQTHHLRSILVEGGNQLLTAFHQEKLMNQVFIYMAPKIMGEANSLSPLGGRDLVDISQIESLHSQEFIPLGVDMCVMAKTAQTPLNYKEFLNV